MRGSSSNTTDTTIHSLSINSQPIDLSVKIKNIHDKIDSYTDKRGNKQEAIDIVNSKLLFSEDSIFANWENGVLELKEIILEDEQMKGDFHLQLKTHLPRSVYGLVEEYIDFLEINYQIGLNVQDIEALKQQVINIIDGFVISVENDYKIDLGEDSLITMVGWEDIVLDSREKKLYIKGALLSFEDESDYITRVSKLDDMYLLSGKDGTEVRLYIRSTRLVLESDFVHTTKLPLYVQALDKYLLQEYKEKFGLEKEKIPKTVEKVIKRKRKKINEILNVGIGSLFSKDGWFETETIYPETEEESIQIEAQKIYAKEDIRGKSLSEILEEDDDELQIGFPPNDEFFVEEANGELVAFSDTEESDFNDRKRNLEEQIEDKQLLTIINRILEHIEKKIYTIENYKKTGNGKEKNRKKEELEKIQEFVLAVNLLEIYKYYKKHFIEDVLNLAYLKDIIRKKIDIHTIGFDHYFYCGDDKKKVYEDNDAEATHDIGYSPNALYIHASIQKNRRLIYNTQLDMQVTKGIKERPMRRYSRNGEYMMMSSADIIVGKTKRKYKYCIHHLGSEETFLDMILERKEKKSLTRRATYDMIDDYLLVIGDEKLRAIFMGEDRKKDLVLSIHSEDYTIATESKNLFVYSNKKLWLYSLGEKGNLKILKFTDFLGERVEVLYMHARKGKVKVIYMQDGKLNYSIYSEKNLLKNCSYANSTSSEFTDNTTFSKPIAHYDITNINNIDLASKIQGAELFFSEDNKYAIFVKDKIIYTIRFTEYGIKLFTTETMGINHIFRVRYSPDGACAILRDGNVVYKLDLDLIDNLQTDEKLEKKLELLEKRRNLVTVIQSIYNKELNRQIEVGDIKLQNLDKTDSSIEIINTEKKLSNKNKDKEIDTSNGDKMENIELNNSNERKINYYDKIYYE